MKTNSFFYNSIFTVSKALIAAFMVLVVIGASVSLTYAAVGCTLNDPDRDVKRIFPQSTGYRTDFISIKEAGGEMLYNKIKEQLGDTLDPIYESIDVPYSFYDILKGKDVIAHIHGVNQKGKYGGMQLILATDLKGKIVAFYYQKMSSPEAEKFMNKGFTNRFIGKTLDDFLKGSSFVNDPSKNSNYDFQATLRGIKKNLILLKELKFSKESYAKVK